MMLELDLFLRIIEVIKITVSQKSKKVRWMKVLRGSVKSLRDWLEDISLIRFKFLSYRNFTVFLVYYM